MDFTTREWKEGRKERHDKASRIGKPINPFYGFNHEARPIFDWMQRYNGIYSRRRHVTTTDPDTKIEPTARKSRAKTFRAIK